MKLQCAVCHEIFDELNADERRESFTSEAWGQVMQHDEVYLRCPACGSDDLDDHKEPSEPDECPECEGAGCPECGGSPQQE